MVFKAIKDYLTTKLKDFFTWIKPVLKEYGIILLILLLEFILIRFYEFLYLRNTYHFNIGQAKFTLLGVYYDFLFISLLSMIFLIPFSILYKISRKISRILFYLLNSILILVILILIDYLRFTFTPLDHAVFAYPVNELFYIAKESVNIDLLYYVRYIIVLSVGIYISYILFKRLKFKLLTIITLLFLLSGILLTKNLNPARRNFLNNTAFNLSINKLSYFSKSCANYFLGKSDINAVEFKQVVKKYHNINKDIFFNNKDYPLEHSPDTSDVLGTFFNLNSEPPNLVFIIMESLSSAFCGNNAYLGNYTPFIDSIIDHSLYWENFLSTSERTFNAIPSIFGSLPYGEKGFMNLVQTDFAVNHTTLIKWLNENGYQTNFFYGGWTDFDNMDKFMRYQDIDFILSKFGDNYSKIEKDKNGVSWGYPDKQVYQRSFEILDSVPKNPRLDIYLTLSLHHPFKPPNKEYYHKKFLDIIEKSTFNTQQKEEAKNYAEIFATVLYTDDALKYYFDKYKKRKDYENTIFIITGDHRVGSQNIKNRLDIYHVPLIIFSPMLKRSVTFSSVSSHANIAPTFYAFLAKNFGFKMPQKVSWIAKPIDFETDFRNTHNISLMRTNRSISDYVTGNYFVSGNELYRLQNNFNLQKLEDNKLLDSLRQDLTTFVTLNNYITKHNLLLSDE